MGSRFKLGEAWGEHKLLEEWLLDPRFLAKTKATFLLRVQRGMSVEKAMSQPHNSQNVIIEGTPCQLKLPSGNTAYFDKEDLELIRNHKWSEEIRSFTSYLQTTQAPYRLHRFLVAAEVVDHRDGNGLNNCRENLRATSKLDNARNTKKFRGTSRFKGVSSHRGSWRGSIRYQGRQLHLGVFKTEEEAAKIYNEKATELFGEFARLNLIGEANPDA